MVLSQRKKHENFSEWFEQVTLHTMVYDYRFPVKGCGVWPGYGFKLRRLVLDIMRRLLDESGHEECLFPTLIPKSLLEKEAEHVKSFEGEVFWITKGGFTELGEKLALRPTSETVIMPMLKLWIKDYKDLPVKLYQVVSVFRYETKATHPMIRVREVTTFKEGHSAHATYEDAEKHVWNMVELYKKFFDELCIPYLVSKRPDWDKFAGAVYSIAFDTIMPDGRALQIGTIHHLGQNFSKAFDVKYLKADGSHEYVWTTSYGISERVIAALIAIHGDDHGLVLPPNVAPIQAVVVPIPYKGKEFEVYEETQRAYSELKAAGFRVTIDDRRDVTPGSKFYEWELKGVPLRVEIGPRDVEKGVVTLVRRDDLTREEVPRSEVVAAIHRLAEDIIKSLKTNAWNNMKSRILRARDLEEASSFIKARRGIAEMAWCGHSECGLALEENLEAKILGTAIETIEVKSECVNCDREATKILRVAKTY
ncbi:MAG: proline--tRNA ligase [Candidatus Nezhaarchaeota archaeon]|nr:proline--tRNA ligase [Candidatus Nezhaarchaeota archaeon]